MFKFLSHTRLLLVLTMVGSLGMTSCQNGNLFGSLADPGDSSDPEILLADAENALRKKDYGKALQLYEAVLSQNNKNSLALYGAANSAVGSAGLNFSLLIANLSDQVNAAPSVNNLGEWVQGSRVGSSADTTVDPNSILRGLPLAAIDNIIDTAICRLHKIVAGAADGTIPPGSIDVLMNLGSLCVIRAILRPIRANLFELTNTNGDFDLTKIDTATFNSICGSQAGADLITQMAGDVSATWALFNRAATLLGLDSNSIIVQLRDDVRKALDLLLNSTSLIDASDNSSTVLPPACITVLTNAGITFATFGSFGATTIDTPPAGC